MYLLLDSKNMAVLYRFDNNVALANIASIETPHLPVAIFEEANLAVYGRFTAQELREMYENLTGERYTGYYIDKLIHTIVRVLVTVPMSNIVAFEAYQQANWIKGADKGYYRYVYGSNKPEALAEPLEFKPLTGSLSQALANPLPHATAPASAPISTPWTPAPAPATPPKYAPPWL